MGIWINGGERAREGLVQQALNEAEPTECVSDWRTGGSWLGCSCGQYQWWEGKVLCMLILRTVHDNPLSTGDRNYGSEEEGWSSVYLPGIVWGQVICGLHSDLWPGA